MPNKVPIYCSLIPTELLVARGFTPDYLLPEDMDSGYSCSSCQLHENICSYARGVFDEIVKRMDRYSVVVVPTSCDAMKKLYNELRETQHRHKVILFEYPKLIGDAHIKFLSENLKGLDERLRDIVTSNNSDERPASIEKNGNGKPKIAIFGANVPTRLIVERLKRGSIGYELINHCLMRAISDEGVVKQVLSGNFYEYAQYLIDKNMCPRTIGGKIGEILLRKFNDGKFSGIIINTYKFCDFQTFDYKFLKENLPSDTPILLLEHEWSSKNEGQIMTRVEAFLERMGCAGSMRKVVKSAHKFFIGIDSGSHATKLAVVDRAGKVVFTKICPTGTSVRGSAENLISSSIVDLKCSRSECFIVATGYGRSQIESSDHVITEISCHALGAHSILKKPATIIDIGGQDSKVMKISDDGKVLKFSMNDKCAAGTGRFLEVIAERLEISLSDFAELSHSAKDGVEISSMCSVFAESEVISLLASNIPREYIAKGIHRAIAQRTASMVRRISEEGPYFMTGGVAKNKAIIKELSDALSSEVTPVDNPQLTGAIGAAITGLRGVR